jgi:hypothetical protein
MNKKIGILAVGVLFSAALAFPAHSAGTIKADTVNTAESTSSPLPTATETSAVESTTDSVSGSAVDVSNITISKKKVILKAGKKETLTISGTSSTAVWTSEDVKIAKVSAKGVVKAVKTGKTVVTAVVDGVSVSCNVTVVAKMSKKDFSKFTGENFVAYCQRMGYDGGYAWKGQWKGDSKKRKTYRGIKIGATKTAVAKVYGDFTLSKCKSKDPFTKMKGLKKNKVKYYNDETWGKYRIRFYYNSKKKVVAIILACNINNIKKSSLSSYL